MAREQKKRVELRAVDDEVAPTVDVVRLENPETGHNPKDEKSVLLGSSDAEREPTRLDMPSRDEVELRTHQPGIDVLIDAGAATTEFTEESWGASGTRSHPIPWGWFLLIGLAIAGALAWSLTHLEQAEVQAEHIRDETESFLAREEREEQEARELIGRIETALRRFFKTASVESLAGQVRQPERVLPLMRSYYLRESLRVTPVESIRALQPVTLDNRGNFWIASVVLFDGRMPNLFIEIDPSGNPLIDWEALVRYQPMPWDRFASERPAGTALDFRVYAERDTLFSHEFSDANRWLCFRLTAPYGVESMFGYVIADSEEARTLLEALQKSSGGKVSLILRLCIPERLQSRQGVVIEKVLSTRWIYVDPPESAS